MYATHVVVVMEACLECICSNTNALESQGKYIHEKPLIMNKIHYIIVGSDLVHVHVFPIPKLKPILNHPH
jgi:hypothetical protein